MALITCHECKKEISSEAKSCPSCSAPMRGTIEPKKRTSFVTWLIGGFFSLVVIETIISQNNDAAAPVTASMTPEQKAAHELELARYACQEFTKKILHDPDSAEFEDYRRFWAEEKRGIYHVQPKLRAKNGFNAMRKMTIDCVATKDKGDWIALSMKQT